MSECKVDKVESAEECGSLRQIRNNARGKAMVDFLADRRKGRAKLIHAQAAGLSIRRAPKLMDKALRENWNGNCRRFSRCGSLLDGNRQVETGGFWGSRIHVPENTASALRRVGPGKIPLATSLGE